MITFATLMLVLSALAIIALIITYVVGGTILLVFGDIAVCVLIIVLLIKLFIRLRK